jgi:hypothetical protein
LTQSFLPIIQLSVVVIAGAVGYLSTIWLVERDALINAAEMVGIKRLPALVQDNP